ncbi:uncharacterized protein BP01DRAFT_396153 [Aspergillus saccharolyticus JOP 1030-1]|uniref:Uncharacterized protein n=1 Tax=Aspergillus saccharolyticus JOP 1030-1 TaxID=1450539 RepID=A0A318ZII2_9EURO|nr:hypothetical protein BP01DRAFT_396153 [Aspergillus saccharolyticus JOP 1030-1]PYH40048.1 hypothetical protein BP01DRAFT_396153 [Aspergillus saccharolyticus JOP 1030-1]
MPRSRSEHGGPISGLVHGITTGIGFATEVHGYRKARKAAREGKDHEQELEQHSKGMEPSQHKYEQEDTTRSVSSSPPPPYTPSSSSEETKTAIETADNLEYSWQLDEAQDRIVDKPEYTPRKSKQGTANPDKIISAFLSRRPPPELPPSTQLTYPVAIPQRRPKAKTRGFIRAYAPDLQTVGIDQDTWFDMVETLNEASLANPWINAINLASLAASPLPFAISTAISVAIMVATDVAIEAQSRYRQNKALDRLNQEFFRPRGLYCLIMTWDAAAADSHTNIDINSTVQNTMDSQGRMSHRFQSSNGVTNGMESIQMAELIFPGLDLLATRSKEEQTGFKKRLERGKLFVDDYMDRRAQAKFYAENPDSHLTQAGKPKFASKYADPTHPIHSGLSLRGREGTLQQRRSLGSRDELGRGIGGRRSGGGLLGLVSLAADQIAAHRDPQKARPENSNSDNPPAPYGRSSSSRREEQQPDSRVPASRRAGKGLSLKKLLSSKVLYLMVVNMPTEEELAQARSLTATWRFDGEHQRI